MRQTSFEVVGTCCWKKPRFRSKQACSIIEGEISAVDRECSDESKLLMPSFVAWSAKRLCSRSLISPQAQCGEVSSRVTSSKKM